MQQRALPAGHRLAGQQAAVTYEEQTPRYDRVEEGGHLESKRRLPPESDTASAALSPCQAHNGSSWSCSIAEPSATAVKAPMGSESSLRLSYMTICGCSALLTTANCPHGEARTLKAPASSRTLLAETSLDSLEIAVQLASVVQSSGRRAALFDLALSR